MKALYKPQVEHIERLLRVLDRHESALDASKCGLGKTVCAAEIARIRDQKLLVVAPLSTLPAWEKELADRGVKPLAVINYEKSRGKKCQWTEKVGAQWIWKVPDDTLIVFDEAQRGKAISSITSKIMVSAKPFSTLLLSGSLAQNPLHFRAAGYLLGLHRLRDFWQWARKRGCEPAMFGGLEFTGGIEELDKLHHEIFPEHGSQMDPTEMKQFMPDNTVIFEEVDFGDDHKLAKLYQNLEEELLSLADSAAEDAKGAEALTAQLRARAEAELLKVPLLAERAQDLAAEGNSVIVFLTFNASLAALSERLGDIPLISGQHGDRQKIIEDFQADRIPILGVNVAAGGVGISLHGPRPRATLLTPSFNPVDILQALGRAPRVSGGSVIQHVLGAIGTIEEKVMRVLQEKLAHINTVNDGDKDSTASILASLRNKIDIPPPIPDTKSPLKTEPSPSTEPVEEHAKFNPSSLGMFERCPGYRNRNEETEQSKKGTRIHKALETGKLGDLVEEERPVAQMCQDFVDGLIADRLPTLPDFDYREVKLHMDLGGEITTFGTCDRLIIYGAFAYMVDYKSGYRAVTDAAKNAQAWAYVIGAFQRFPLLQEIEFFFLLPNRDEQSYHLFNRSDVPAMQLRLNSIIRRAMVADPKQFQPGPELCEYCARQTECPRIADKVLLISAREGDGLPVPASNLVNAARPEDIPHLLRLAPLAEAWAAKVREDALKLNLEEGVEIPGFVRQERSLPRSVNSVYGAWKAIKDTSGISLEEFLASCSKVSIPKLEDLVSEKAPNRKKKEARMNLENSLRHADVMSSGGSIYYLRESKN